MTLYLFFKWFLFFTRRVDAKLFVAVAIVVVSVLVCCFADERGLPLRHEHWNLSKNRTSCCYWPKGDPSSVPSSAPWNDGDVYWQPADGV